MKKKSSIVSIFIVLTVFICIVAVFIYHNSNGNDKSEQLSVDYSQIDFSKWENGTLIVNGKVCENAMVRIHPEGYAVIPILRIANELGATVTWENEDTAIIRYNDIKFTLNTKAKTFIKSGMNYSIFDVLSGKTKGVPYFEREGDDFMVADEWASSFLSDLNAYKHIDSESNIVYIESSIVDG